jgi:hypothetical protein
MEGIGDGRILQPFGAFKSHILLSIKHKSKEIKCMILS